MRIRSLTLLLGLPLWAQQPLTLKQAVNQALNRHPSADAVRSGVKAAESRIAQARGGYLPRVNYTESFMRSDNPVFVFSSLLAQHRFSEQNFAIGTLNRPGAMNNFQSQLTIDQVVYDAGQTKLGVKSAQLGRELAGEEQRGNQMGLIAGVVRAYHGAVLAAESLKVANEGVRSAEADLARAESVRSAGMSTDADVLSIKVHLAAMREQQIRRRSDVEVARATLNDAMGLPLPESHELTTALTPVSLDAASLEAYEREGRNLRPEIRQARVAMSLAETQAATARSALLPQVVLHAGFEADRERFVNRGGTNWIVSVSLRWNLFSGFSDRHRIEEASYSAQRARAQQTQTDSAVRLQVRRAYADYEAARQRIEVAEAAVSQADESLRITKNRFEAGLSTVTDLLRTETAVLEAKTRRLAAVFDQRIAAANLQLAAGALTAESGVLN